MSVRSVLLVIVAIVFVVSAQSIPKWPPAPVFSSNVTYTPGFFEGDEELSGAFYFDIKQGFALDAKDSLRTFEKVVSQSNTKKQYVSSKFGEFPPDCIEYSDLSLTGEVSFVPPFGFNSQTIKDAKFIGSQPCGNKKCDTFEYQASGKKVVFSFSGGALVSIQEVGANDQKLRKMEFAGITVLSTLPDGVLNKPSGVQCNPSSSARRLMRGL
ncbi:MPAH1 [Acrasis kona]|uniref:MPAH1 n=1 Tax=Acrasis kona TaxID=1008807 RepID=A0AAW2ZBD0_9EUKA